MNMRFAMTRITGMALGLVAGSALIAQTTTGSLAGAVKDQNGKAVGGARVIVNSPALFSPRETVTDEKGEWRAPLLPVGTYTITVTKDGLTAGARDIRIGIGMALRQDLALKRPAERAEAMVEVIAAAADVDKTDTKTAVNYSGEQLQALAVADRGFSGAADLTPGVATGKSGNVAFNIRGGGSQHTSFRVNGADIKDDYQGEATGTYYIEDNIEDVQVILSPLNARSGRNLSGAVNVVTKSGGNDFRGSIRATLNRNSWRSSIPAVGGNSDNLNREYQVTFSGPILKDKIWFSLGTILRPHTVYNNVAGPAYTNVNRIMRTGDANIDAVTGTGPAGYRFTKFDDGKNFTSNDNYKYYEGKLTYGITPDHTIEANYIWSDWAFQNWNSYGSFRTGRLAALGEQLSEYRTLGFNYRGLFSSSAFIEARFTRVDANNVWAQGDPTYAAEGFDGWFGGGSTTRFGWRGYVRPFGAGLSPDPERRDNRSGNVNLKLFLDGAGNHELDLGVDYYKSMLGTNNQVGTKNQQVQHGAGVYESLGGGDYLFPVINHPASPQGGNGDWYDLYQDWNFGLAPTLDRWVGKDGTHANTNTAFYVNDTWTINSHWNAMFGVRFDKHKVEDTDGTQMASASSISPRLMVRFDPNGDSKHMFTATAARFGGDFITSFTSTFIKSATSKQGTFGWTANAYAPGDPTDPTGRYGVNFVDFHALNNPANYGFAMSFSDSSKGYSLAGDLEPPSMDELTLGYRRGFKDGSFVKLTGIYRKWSNQWALSQDYAPDQMVTLTDPFNQGLPDLQTQVTRVFNSNELTRQYKALELEWNSKVSAIWSIGGNWTYSRLTGNDNGGESSGRTFNFRNNNVNPYFFQRRHLIGTEGLTNDDIAPDGPLVSNQTNRIRLNATSVLPLGKGRISFSWLLRYDSGLNWGVTYDAPFENIAALPYPAPTPPQTYTRFVGGRGQYQDNDTYSIDFKLAFSVPLGLKSVQLFGDIQVNNLLNRQMPTYRNRTIYSDTNAGTTLPYIDNTALFGKTETLSNYWYGRRTVQTSLGLRF